MSDDEGIGLTTKLSMASIALRVFAAFLVISSGSFGLGWALGSTAVVNPGEKAVRVSGGQFQGVVEPGIHPGVPLLDRYRVFDMRHNIMTFQDEDQINAITQDDINVKVSMKVRWDIRDGQDLAEIYKNVAVSQDNLANKVVRPAIEDAARTCATQQKARQVVSDDRAGYKDCVKGTLQDELEGEGLVIFTVSITNMDYPESIAQKFQSEKQAELDKRIAEKEGEAQVVRAQKRAEAIRTIRQELTGDYIRYYAIEEGLSNAETIYVVPSTGSGVPVSGEIPIEGNGGSAGNESSVFNESG